MRLIDADKIGLTDFEILMCDGSYKGALEALISKVERQPTVDAVPVVRCKDCKYVSVEPCKGFEEIYVCDRNYWTRAQGGNMPNDFCSHGERRRGWMI